MIDYSKNFRQLLVSAVGQTPVYYEAFNKKNGVPCVSYIELNNNCLYHGDTLDYSHISYRVKVWAKTIAELQTLALAIDDELQDNGFRRLSTNETTDDDLVVKIMTYQGLGRETYEEAI